MKILIAEDSESVRMALRMVLEYFGHEVVGQAVNGETAVAMCANIRPDVVLLDVRMPGASGLACARLLRRRNPDAKVVIVTGGRTTERQALAAGARALVEKPFDIFALNRLLQSVASNS